MNKRTKTKFIRSLCNSVRDETIKRIQYMPDEWDGIELREYIARMFEYESYFRRKPQPDKRRLREFKNATATRFGL